MSLRVRIARSRGAEKGTKFATALSVLLGGAACGDLTVPNPNYRPELALPAEDGGMGRPLRPDGGTMDAGMADGPARREDPELCLEGRTLRLIVDGIKVNQDIQIGELFTIRVENTGEMPLTISSVRVIDAEGVRESFSAKTEDGEKVSEIQLRPGDSTSLTLRLQENTEGCTTKFVILLVGYQSNEEGCEVSRTAPTRINAVCTN